MHSEHRKCITDLEIASFIDGRLSPGDKESFEQAIMDCENCWEAYLAVTSVSMNKADLYPEDVPERVIRKAVDLVPEPEAITDIIMSFVRDALKVVYFADDFHMLTPLPAGGLRTGKGESAHLVMLKKSFEDVDVVLEIERLEGNLCNIKIEAAAVRDKGILHNMRIELVSKKRVLLSTLLEDGEAFLEDLATGTYTMRLVTSVKVCGEITIKLQ